MEINTLFYNQPEMLLIVDNVCCLHLICQYSKLLSIFPDICNDRNLVCDRLVVIVHMVETAVKQSVSISMKVAGIR